jgi:hypothetical protein
MLGLVALDPVLEGRVRLAVHEWGSGAVNPDGNARHVVTDSSGATETATPTGEGLGAGRPSFALPPPCWFALAARP